MIAQHRGVEVLVDGRWLVDFSSNDALGIARDHGFAASLWQDIRPLTMGAGAARLVSGLTPSLRAAEAVLARWSGAPSALLFPSASQANAALAALFMPEDCVVVDKRVHGSIRWGLQAARCTVHSFRHNAAEHLARVLERSLPAAVWTESLFSMDGDIPPLAKIAQLCQQHSALLLLDEAHAIGVLGPGGRGLGAGLATVRTVGLGKALGLFGGAILGPDEVCQALLHFAPPAMFTTALPPWMGEAICAVVEEVQRREEERQRVARRAAYAKESLMAAGFSVLGDHHIVAIVLGAEALAVDAAHFLRSQGYLVFAARYPTVPLGAARIRLVISSGHTEGHLDGLTSALTRWRTEHEKYAPRPTEHGDG
jgi:8-amino-7-oxononanoate synthase